MPRRWIGGALALVFFLPTALRAAAQSLQISIPARALTGRSDAPPVTVAVVDPSTGTIDTSMTDKIGIEIGANPSGATLQGTVVVDAVQGVAVFRDVTLDRGGDGFTLVAWSPKLADVTSAPFQFEPAPRPQEALGYGCSSAGAGELAALGLIALFGLRRRRRSGWTGLMLALGMTVAGAASAADPLKTPPPAQPTLDTARVLNRKGIEALSQGRYDQAIAYFEGARKSANSPSLLYNLAEAHRRAGHVAEALDFYHAYVAAVPDPSKRADLSDLERLERRQLAPEQVKPPPVSAREALAEYDPPAFAEKPLPRRGWFHAPGVFAGLAWLPRDQRAGYETLLEIEAGNGFRVSAGALITPRPGGRLAVERRIYQEEEFSFGFALRGMIASFPGQALKGGGGGFSVRMQATDNIDVSSGVYLEYYSTQGESFLTPIVTAGISLHL